MLLTCVSWTAAIKAHPPRLYLTHRSQVSGPNHPKSRINIARPLHLMPGLAGIRFNVPRRLSKVFSVTALNLRSESYRDEFASYLLLLALLEAEVENPTQEILDK